MLQFIGCGKSTRRGALARSLPALRRGQFEPLEDRHLLSAASPFAAAPAAIAIDPAGLVAAPALDPNFPWRNAVNCLDVNNNGSIAPIDALIVINDLIANGARTLPSPSGTTTPPPFLDVSKDNNISAIDAIQVVNELILRGGAQASGVPTARLVLHGEAFDPTAQTLVRFIDIGGHSINAVGLTVTDTTVETVIPVFYDIDNLQFRSGVVSVKVTQYPESGPVSTLIYDSSFLIKDLPQPSGTTGDLTSELLNDLEGLTNLALIDYQTLAAAGDIEADAATLLGYLQTQQANLGVIRTQVDALIASDGSSSTSLFKANNVSFFLNRASLADADRQIAGWIQRVTGQAGPVTVTQLRNYLDSFVNDARIGPANDDADAIARARKAYTEILEFADATIAAASALEYAAAGPFELTGLAPAAAMEVQLAASAAGLLSIADLELAALDTRGSSDLHFDDTLAFLVNSRITDLFIYVGEGISALTPTGDLGPALLQYAQVIGLDFALSTVQDPQAFDFEGPLGIAIFDNFDAISAGTPPFVAGMSELLGTAPLQTTEAGGTAQFRLQLKTQPTAQVKILLTCSRPSAATVTSLITIDPSAWLQLQTVIVTGINNGIRDGVVPYTISMVTQSADPAYNGLHPTPVTVTHIDN